MPLIRRIPKRGFHNPFRKQFVICNLADLQRFKANDVVDWELLQKEKIVGKSKDGLKILGKGDLKHPLTVKAHAFSESAIKKIEALGGKTEVIGRK